MSFQMLILISALYFAAHSEAKWELQDNVYIIDSLQTPLSTPEEVCLHCNVSGKHNASVYWKQNNKLCRRGKSCERVKEPKQAGNFTCWSSATNELLKYTTLYVAKIYKDGRIKYQILKMEGSSNRNFKCTANNYSGKFTCFWMIASGSQNQTLKFSVRSLNTDNTSGNVTCGEPIQDSAIPGRYSISCMKEKPCLSAEEYQLTEIGLHVFDEDVYLYENATFSFFIKDILKPDVTECEIVRKGTSRPYLIWKPPQTWSTPVSYYGLIYQIKTVGGTKEKICEVDNPIQLENGNHLGCSIESSISDRKYYIRSRDRYNKNSAWSEWSEPCSTESQKNGQSHHTHDTKIKITPCNCQKN